MPEAFHNRRYPVDGCMRVLVETIMFRSVIAGPLFEWLTASTGAASADERARVMCHAIDLALGGFQDVRGDSQAV
jgi:hypothetical protein